MNQVAQLEKIAQQRGIEVTYKDETCTQIISCVIINQPKECTKCHQFFYNITITNGVIRCNSCAFQNKNMFTYFVVFIVFNNEEKSGNSTSSGNSFGKFTTGRGISSKSFKSSFIFSGSKFQEEEKYSNRRFIPEQIVLNPM
jgi:hypothetical protein